MAGFGICGAERSSSAALVLLICLMLNSFLFYNVRKSVWLLYFNSSLIAFSL
jgi:hypothetical protein